MRFVAMLLLCLTTAFSHATGILDRLSGGEKTNFLSPDQAFMLDVTVQDAHTLQANFTVAKGYYLYRDKISFSSDSVNIQSSDLPQGELKHDPNFGDIQVFHQSFVVKIRLKDAKTRQVFLKSSYQGCSDQGLCYPPIEKILPLTLPETAARIEPSVSAILPAITSAVIVSAIPVTTKPTTDSQIAHLFATGNFWLIISFFFGAGLLLAFTPCIFPMIPILSGIIVGQGHKITQKHAFILSLTYVLGMAITYAIAGIAAGLSGDLISNAMQTPAVLGSFAAIFVLLSLAMFGFYDLQLPTALQSRLSSTSNQLHGGHISSVFIMGALSAIIMGPCVAAPLAAALLYIGKTHDALLGGTALFVLALGMGAPLLLIGTSAGALLPKAGSWMETVKRFFGVLMLALAIWIVQPLLPINVQMLLWSTLLIVSSTYLHVLDVQPHHTTGWHKLQKGLGLFVLLLGIAYLIGALSGAKDILRPLSGIAVAQAATPAPPFKRIKNLAELNQHLAQGKIVLLDFYADWCVSCKEMERDTFSDPIVQARWANAVRLQIDMTQNTADDKALLKHFGLYGPPAILFFDKQGKENPNFRVIGYQDALLFTQTLQRVGL